MNRSLLNRCVAASLLFTLAVVISLAVATLPAKAAVYTDALGDNYGGAEVDISNVVITNDATNLYIQINLNPAANIGPTANHFANYEVGIQTGASGGQTAINGTFGTGNPAAGNPYGNSVGISTGENFFIGSFLDGASFSGGAGTIFLQFTAHRLDENWRNRADHRSLHGDAVDCFFVFSG